MKIFDKNKNISKLCFGTLALSNLQNSQNLISKANVLEYAYKKGINFFDTAELYDNYDVLRMFLKGKKREDLYIATKSYAYDRDTAKSSVEKALNELETDYLDVFMLHEQDNGNNFMGHYGAVEEFMCYKEKGVIKSFGVSTHNVECVLDCSKFDEVDIIFSIVNRTGIGINDGIMKDMLSAIKIAKQNGKKLMAMKAYGGGHLLSDTRSAFDFVNEIEEIDYISLGMKTIQEVDVNLCYLHNKHVPIELIDNIRKTNRKLHIANWCEGCGKCVEKCKQNAISIQNDICVVDMNKCVLCSYCASACESFCIKII